MFTETGAFSMLNSPVYQNGVAEEEVKYGSVGLCIRRRVKGLSLIRLMLGSPMLTQSEVEPAPNGLLSVTSIDINTLLVECGPTK